MYSRLTLSCFIFFCFLLTRGNGQRMDTHLEESLTTHEGLPSNEVYDIIQDKNKFLWFATDNGIVRYDGNSLKVFNTNDGLPNNTVFRLYEQPDGKIYGEASHNQFFYISNDSVRLYPYNDLLSVLMPGYVRCFSFHLDALHHAHFGSSNNSYVIDEKGKLLEPGKTAHDTDKSPSLKFMDLDGYVFTFRKTIKGNPDQKMIIRLFPDGHAYRFPIPGKEHSFDANYGVKAGDEKYAIIYKSAVQILSAGKPVYSIACASRPVDVCMIDSLLWICYLNDGARAYSFSGDTLIEQKHVFADYSVTHVLKDHENGYWFSTRERGVIHLYDFDITRIFTADMNQNINAFYKDKDLELVGFDDGVIQDAMHSRALCTAENFITSIDRLDDDNLLFYSGTIPEIYNLSTGKIKLFFQDKTMFCPLPINMNDSLFLFERLNDLYICNKKEQRLSQFINSLHILDRAQAGCYLESDIILGTDKGLIRIDTTSRSIKQSVPLPSPVVALARFGHLLAVACNNGDFFTYSNNITRPLVLEGRSGVSKIFDMQKAGNMIIVATNIGILKYAYDERTDKWEYLEFVNIPDVIKIRVIDGQVYYLTRKTIFHDRNEVISNFAPVTYFSRISVNGNVISGNSNPSFDYDHNNIEFHVNCISYSASFLNYRYRLIGQEKEDQLTSDSRIGYSALNPGDYEFVISSTTNGVNYSPELHFRFTIYPPFWKTWWFIGLCIIAGFLLVAFIYSSKLRKAKAMAQVNLSIANLKARALSNQLNPHLIYNILNSIQGMISESETERANLYLSRFAKFMRSSLAYSKQVKVPLAEEIALTQNYIELEMIRFPQDLSITIENKFPGTGYDLPPLIIQPFIENAIKHGVRPSRNKTGEIRIIIEEADNALRITIEDNGVGFAEPFSFDKGNGLRISKERLEILDPRNTIHLDTASQVTRIVLTIFK